MKVITGEHGCSVMNKYEYMITKCAAQQANEFDVVTMRSMLWDMGEKRIGKFAVKSFLNGLVKKKVLKKRYSRKRYLKWVPLYWACYDEEYFAAHTKDLDLSVEIEKKAWEKEVRMKQKEERRLYYSPYVIAEPGYYLPDEKTKLEENIDSAFPAKLPGAALRK